MRRGVKRVSRKGGSPGEGREEIGDPGRKTGDRRFRSRRGGDLCQKLAGSQDAGGPEGMEDEEILVAGDKVGGLSTHGEFEEPVVLGIAAVGDGGIDFHEIGVVDEDSQKGHASVFGQAAVKLRLAQDLGQFCRGGGREEESPGGCGAVEGLTGDRLGKEEGADQGVCIEDNAQVTRH